MSSPCWGTGSSWGSPHWTADCTPPCPSSCHTWPSLTWPTPAARCPRCWSTSWVQPSPSPFWLHHKDLSLCEFRSHQVSAPGGDVLWLVCSHLPPPPIFCHCELESWHQPGGDFLGMWLPPGPGPCGSRPEAALLWASWNQPLLLWNPVCPKAGLCWYRGSTNLSSLLSACLS